jgi:L-serine dehydratase
VRIARAGVRLLGDLPDEAEIVFYNSFARTYEGHGSDRAIVAGLLDFKTDDVRIKTSFDEAKKAGLIYKFKSVGNASTRHPNTIHLKLSKGDRVVELEGESRGGGVVKIVEVNGFHAGFTTSLNTLIIEADDVKGSITFLTSVLAQEECNIATMTVSRKGKNHLACQILEIDSEIGEITLQYLRSLKWIHHVNYIPTIE